MKLILVFLLVTLSIVSGQRDRDQDRGNGRNRGNGGGNNHGNGGGNNGGGNNGGFWNPFHDNFNMANIRGAPEGFGTFPTFGSGFGSSGFGNTGFGNTGFGNSGFGNTGFGGNSDNRDRSNDRGNGRPKNGNNNKNNNNNNNNNNNGFAPNTFSWGAPTFVDFGSTFENFRNQFGNQFPAFGGNGGFGNFGGGFGGVVPVVPAGGGVAPVDENEGESDSPTMAPSVAPNVVTVSSSTSQSSTVSTTTFASNSAVQSMTVTNRNCTQEGLVIGLTQNANDDCGSVECECFHGIYFCYSTCAPPPANQTCDAVVPSGSNCPTYTNCGPIANATVGLAEVFRCDTRNNAVHPAICWMYEILYGKLTEPLGYFESVAEPACSVSTQCFCGANGFVQPALLKQEDFKTPANNQVFQRAQGGRKGAFASN